MAWSIQRMTKAVIAEGLCALLVVASTVSAYADEILIPNSSSPEGRFALYAVDATEQFRPATLEIRGLKDQKPRIKLDGGGYVRFASGYTYGDEDKNSIFVVWNPTESRIAMMVRDSKRSGSLIICKRRNDSFKQNSKLPEFMAIAEKALALKRDGRYIYVFPKTWINQDKLLIKMRFDDIALKDSKPYQFECTLEFDTSSGKVSNFQVLNKTREEG